MLINAMTFQLKLVLRIVLGILITCSLTILYVIDNEPSDITSRRHHNVIDAVERHCLNFDIGGHMFNELGHAGPIHGEVTSCLIHSFSPYIEREAAKRFL